MALLLRAIVALFSSAAIAVLFFYKDEEGQIQNRLESYWIDRRSKAAARKRTIAQAIGLLANRFSAEISRFYEGHLWSRQSVGASVCLALIAIGIYQSFALANEPRIANAPFQVYAVVRLFPIASTLFLWWCLQQLRTRSSLRYAWVGVLAYLTLYSFASRAYVDRILSRPQVPYPQVRVTMTVVYNLVSFLPAAVVLGLLSVVYQRLLRKLAYGETILLRITAIMVGFVVALGAVAIPWRISYLLLMDGWRPHLNEFLSDMAQGNYVHAISVGVVDQLASAGGQFVSIADGWAIALWVAFVAMLILIFVQRAFESMITRIVYALGRYSVITMKKELASLGVVGFLFAFGLVPSVRDAVIYWLATVFGLRTVNSPKS